MARRSEQGGTCLLGTACGWCYKRRVTGLSSGRAIAAIITVALAAAVGVAGAGAERKLRIQTLLETRGTVAAFAQDGNRIVWANLAESCRRFVQLRDVRMRKTWPLTGLKGPTCSDARELGGIQPRMALTGRRALWAYFSVSNQGFHFSIYTAAAGDKNEREVGRFSMRGGLEGEYPLRPVPMAAAGRTLVYAHTDDLDGAPHGVYAIGRTTRLLPDTHNTFALAAEGSRLALARTIPAGCACNREPKWSPDGTRLAFVSGRGEGGWRFGAEVYVVNATGGPERKVDLRSAKGFSAVEWSPSGELLLLERNSQLYVAPSSGGRPRLLTAGTGGQWSPDGKRIAYWKYDRSDTRVLYILEATGGTARSVGVGSDPRWSPDGKALLARRDGIFVVPLDGSAARRIAEEHAYYAWAPDGRSIALSDDDDQGTTGVLVMRPDGSEARRLTTSILHWLAWSPDSRELVGSSGDGQIQVLPADGSGARVVGRGWAPAWSPAGGMLSYVAASEIELVNADGSERRVLTSTIASPARNVIEIRRLSANRVLSTFAPPRAASVIALDGVNVALFLPGRRNSTIEVRKTSGALLRRIRAPRRMNEFDLALSGRWVVFHAGSTIRALDWRSGRVTILGQAKYQTGLSVQGRRVAWAEQGRTKSRVRAVVLPG